jgi:hypothetical protein
MHGLCNIKSGIVCRAVVFIVERRLCLSDVSLFGNDAFIFGAVSFFLAQVNRRCVIHIYSGFVCKPAVSLPNFTPDV